MVLRALQHSMCTQIYFQHFIGVATGSYKYAFLLFVCMQQSFQLCLLTSMPLKLSELRNSYFQQPFLLLLVRSGSAVTTMLLVGSIVKSVQYI